MGKAISKNMKLKYDIMTYKHSVFPNLPGILIKVQRIPSCLPLLLVSSSSSVLLLALSLSSGHQGTRMSQQVPAQAEHFLEAYRELQVNLGTHRPEPHRELRIQLGTRGLEDLNLLVSFRLNWAHTDPNTLKRNRIPKYIY